MLFDVPLPELTALRSPFPGMEVVLHHDSGPGGSPGQRYVMRGEALTYPLAAGPYPDPGPMQVYLLQSA